MKLLIVWSIRPTKIQLTKAFKIAAASYFWNKKKNSLLFEQLNNYIKDSHFFLCSALFEMWINLSYGLPKKRRKFEKKLEIIVKNLELKLEDCNIASVFLDILETNYVLHGDTSILNNYLKKGNPVLVVANHSYGPIDGLSLMSLVHSFRNDYSILVNASNSMLNHYPEFANHIISVDVTEGLLRTADPVTAKQSRINSLKRSIKELEKSGKCVIMFPAGNISKAKAWGEIIKDTPWFDGIGFIVNHFVKSGNPITILPIFIEGHMGSEINSQRYQKAFIEEKFKLSGRVMQAIYNAPRNINLHICTPIKSDFFVGFSNKGISEFLYEKVYEPFSKLPIANRLVNKSIYHKFRNIIKNSFKFNKKKINAKKKE